MWKTETPASCFECGQAVQALGDLGGLCIVCMQVFCRRHVVIRNGVANCAACERIRREKEESGPVSQDDADRVSRLLRTDLAATVGNGHEAVVEEAVARIGCLRMTPCTSNSKWSTRFSSISTTRSLTRVGHAALNIQTIRCGTRAAGGNASSRECEPPLWEESGHAAGEWPRWRLRGIQP